MVPSRWPMALRATSSFAAVLACFLGLALIMTLGPGEPCPTGMGCATEPRGASSFVLLAAVLVCVAAAALTRLVADRMVERAERAADPWGDVRVGPRPAR